MIASTLLLLASYLGAAAALWGLLLPLVRPSDPADARRLALVAATLGPLALAWVLAQAMRLAPGLVPAAYAAIVLAAVLLPLALLRRRTAVAAAGLWRSGLDAPYGPAVAFVALLALALGLVMAAVPMYENDPLEYATAARHVYEGRSANLYPFMDSSATNGFYGPWTHPIGYTSLMAWSNIVQGGAIEAGLIRYPAYYHAIVTMLLMVGVGGPLGGALAALLLIVTPIYFTGTVAGAVDPVRVAAVLATIVLVEMAARSGADARRGLAVGVAAGLGFFAHSIGVLLVPMAAAVWLLYGPATLRARFIAIVITAVTAAAVVLPDLVANLRNFHAIVADAPAVWAIPEVRFQEHMQVVRAISTFRDQVLNGVLQGLFGTVYYGLIYWLWAALIVAVGIYAWRHHGLPPWRRWLLLHDASPATRWMVLSAAFVAGWGALAFVSLLAGTTDVVKNYRYALTVLPFVVLFSGLVLAAVLQRWRAGARRWATSVLVALVAAGSMSVGAYHYGFPALRHSIPVSRLDLGSREALSASRLPAVHVARRIDELLQDGGCVLLFRQADYAFYGTRCYRAYYDHTVVDLYRAKEPAEVAGVLGRHDIRVIMLPPYGLPEVYNTGLEAFLADPRRARLAWSWDGYRLFRVGDFAGPTRRVPLARLGAGLELRHESGRRTTALRGRDELVTGTGDALVPSVDDPRWSDTQSCHTARIEPAVHELTVLARGNGHLALDLVDHSAESTASEKSFRLLPLWDGVVSGERRIKVQYLLEPGHCAEQRVRARLMKDGAITISALEIARLEGAAPGPEVFAGNIAEAAGWSSAASGHYSKAWDWGWSHTRGVMFQRLPAGLAAPEVALAGPPVLVGAGEPRSIVVEAEVEGDAGVYLQRLRHRGSRGSCADVRPPLGLLRRAVAQLVSGGREFYTVGAAAVCYYALERTTLRAPDGAGGKLRAEVANAEFESFRVVFAQRPESERSAELVVRRLRVAARYADGSERALYDFQPRPRTYPAIR